MRLLIRPVRFFQEFLRLQGLIDFGSELFETAVAQHLPLDKSTTMRASVPQIRVIFDIDPAVPDEIRDPFFRYASERADFFNGGKPVFLNFQEIGDEFELLLHFLVAVQAIIRMIFQI